MKQEPEPTDWMGTLVGLLIFLLPAGAFVGSIFASTTHIKDWAMKHVMPGAGGWQGWQFALVIELIPIFGLLVLWKLRKINHPPTVPRWIFAIGLVASMVLQVAYVGGVTHPSKVLVAIAPTLLALGATEVLLWLGRAGSDKAASVPSAPAFVPPPPVLVPPPPSPVSPRTSAAVVPGHVPLDIETQRSVSPWTEPPPGRDMSLDATPDITADVPGTQQVGHRDTAQVTATVHPPHVHPTDQDTDTDVPPAGPGDTSPSDPLDTSRDNEDTDGGTPDDQGDTDTDVHPEAEDEDTDTEGDKDIDPRALEALSMRTDKRMTNGQIAAHLGCSTKTVSRLIKQATDAQQEPALAGSR